MDPQLPHRFHHGLLSVNPHPSLPPHIQQGARLPAIACTANTDGAYRCNLQVSGLPVGHLTAP
eukprot:814-Alexandrium_andersonii.AAC.1